MVAVLCALPDPAPAQAPRADQGQQEAGIGGTVADALGRPIEGVTLRLQDPEGREVARANSDKEGRFRFPVVPRGPYAVITERADYAPTTAVVVSGAAAALPLALTLTATRPLDLALTAKQLEAARVGIEPRIGASTYTMSKSAIDTVPGGENAPIDQVILQAPGVVQDNLANGGLHVRNEHLNVQYRINGVTLPDGVSFFGQNLSPRFVDQLQLITGALPAEYGLRTAGIVDLQSKSGIFAPGGSVGLYGGSFGTINPSAEYGGSFGSVNYYVSGDYFQTDHGIEGVTPKYNQIHDDSLQTHGFGYVEKIIDPSSKVSAMVGTFNSQFQIPNHAGTAAPFGPFNGISTFDSAQLHDHQTEGSQFGALSYLRSTKYLDFQISGVTKYSFLHYHPDLNDLAFNGISQDAARTSWVNDFQAEGTYRLTPTHTLRGGLLLNAEHITAKTNSAVLAQTGVDGAGNPIFATTTTNIIDNSEKTGWTYSAYLQDEWKLTPTVTVNYGGRFDVANGFANGNQISPRINAVWQATPSTTIHAGYANYFTPPPLELVSTQGLALFNNTSASCTVSTGTCLNDPIKIERSHYFDVGVAQDVLPGFRVGLDLYYKYSRNLIDEGQFGAPVILTPFNYHVAFNKGVELTTTYTQGGFNYYGNLAIAQQKAEGINSTQFNFFPADLAATFAHSINTDHSQLMTASAGVSYLWDGTRYAVDILAGTGVRTTRPGESINEGTVPSYEQVNLSAAHRFANAPGGPITLRLDVINLLDEVYLLRSSTGIGVFSNQFAPRRAVYAGITKEF